MKSYTKKELAYRAGVSVRTFKRWMKQQKTELAARGVSERAHILPPGAVKWICDYYDIDLD